VTNIEPTQLSLAELGAQIAAEHESAQNAAASALLHAKEAGLVLLRAKGMLRHGEWLPWLRDQCQIAERTAQAYMRIARRWEELEKSATVADLTFREATRLLAKPKPPPESSSYTDPCLEAWTAILNDIRTILEPCLAVLDKPDATFAEIKEVHEIATPCHTMSAEITLRIDRRWGRILNELERRKTGAAPDYQTERTAP
jgi:hypothetical protein